MKVLTGSAVRGAGREAARFAEGLDSDSSEALEGVPRPLPDGLSRPLYSRSPNGLEGRTTSIGFSGAAFPPAGSPHDVEASKDFRDVDASCLAASSTTTSMLLESEEAMEGANRTPLDCLLDLLETRLSGVAGVVVEDWGNDEFDGEDILDEVDSAGEKVSFEMLGSVGISITRNRMSVSHVGKASSDGKSPLELDNLDKTVER